ncbi:Inhibitor of nuclear factor kappa-B kinase subunit alpha [Acropora cervicornis]|uniref:IkappaB kinase n=1 Tax=Acropora cervicornis TaxID=6130 RepID=A0AAD9QRH9_ACRCE|nr:Inhibitor of nuclear factor kappa-B kinase subunit alpha [Acropora cervicornis]
MLKVTDAWFKQLVMEYGRAINLSRDGWMEEGCLGAGGFGTVMLYENKITKEQVALKRCRLELNSHNRKRWQQEVEIMKRLHHPNLVSARDVPPALDVSDDELPLLAMEFCSGGDLRKVLNAPESCCGLKETTVLQIAGDVAAAVEFLHSHRIIHRDLKPENIVINHVDRKVIYKLIDLGYAKELDQASMATTFVGTLKYLENLALLIVLKWTPSTLIYRRVDRKCIHFVIQLLNYLTELNIQNQLIIGVLAQFYLNALLVHNVVFKKGADDICAFFDVKVPNTLCRQLQDKFVSLLRLLLLWDPKRRGGLVLDNGKRECFDMLEKIVNTVVVHVFPIATATLISFEVFPSETVDDLKVKLSEATGVKEEHELLTVSGQLLESNGLVMDICNRDSKFEGDCLLFLISTGNGSLSPPPIFALPGTVHGMVTEPKTLMSYEDLKKAFAVGVNFCWEQRRINILLIEGFRAAQISLLHLNSRLGQVKNDVTTELKKLEAKVDFFNSSLLFPVDDKVFRAWKRAQKKVASFQNNDVLALLNSTMVLQGKIVESQKGPYASGTQAKSKVDGMYSNVLQLFEDLRQGDRRPADSQKIVAVILQFLAQKEKLHKDILSRLSKIISCKSEIREMMIKLDKAKSKLLERQQELEEMQNQRQADLWKILQSMVRFRLVLASNDFLGCVVDRILLAFLLIFFYSQKQRSQDSRRISSGSCTTESIVLIEESSRGFEKFAEVVENLKLDQINETLNLDWEFLEEDSGPDDKKWEGRPAS